MKRESERKEEMKYSCQSHKHFIQFPLLRTMESLTLTKSHVLNINITTKAIATNIKREIKDRVKAKLLYKTSF